MKKKQGQMAGENNDDAKADTADGSQKKNSRWSK